jgi:hypothetical protein
MKTLFGAALHHEKASNPVYAKCVVSIHFTNCAFIDTFAFAVVLSTRQ